jgi:glycosyltransferase involved in cell wall biosynthesis
MSASVKIIQCIRQGLVGGGETHLLSLMTHIDRSRFAPFVLSFTDGPMIQQLRSIDVPVEIIETTKAFDWKVWSKIRRLMAQHRFDLAHAHGTRAASNLLTPSRQLKTPLVYTIHGWSFHQDQNKLVYQLRKTGERYICQRSAANISVSASNQQTGKKEIGQAFHSSVINNGIDPQKFHPGNQYADIRNELGIPADALLFLFLARFTNHKQPLTLIRAFKLLLADYPDAKLLMVGEGDQRAEGEQLAAQLQLSDQIIFSDFRSDVPAILYAADVYVLPSLWEGLPIGLLEAMAMEKAVIGTNVDGTREVIQHGINGILAETNKRVEDLATAMGQLAANPSKRKELGQMARASILSNYNVEVMTRQTEQLYDRVLAGC